jgi:C-terminal processing protease CtpA/Prc
MKSGGLSFPFAVDITDNSILITEYYGNDSTLFRSGDEILQVNGIPSSDILRDLDKLIGGSSIASRRKEIAMNFRNYVWMKYGFEKNYQLVIKNKLKETVQVLVEGVTNEQFQRNRKRYPVISNQRYSLSINNERKTSILNIHSFAELKSFCSFADSAFQVIANNNIRNLIIDIRGNGGGRSIVVDSLMNYLSDKPYSQYKRIEMRISSDLKAYYKDKYPDTYEEIKDYPINKLITSPGDTKYPHDKKSRYKGNLFLLTDETTYSGAATFAGMFKAMKMGTIIGEETGGTIEYFGDYWFVTLPNSGLKFYISPKRFTQFGGTELTRGVVPDYLIPNKNDSIITFTYNLIEKQRNTGNNKIQ